MKKYLIKDYRRRVKSYFMMVAFIISIGLFSTESIFAQEVSKSFSDITGTEWFAADVLDLAGNSNEIIKGFPDGTFGAEKKLGVDQFITMLVRAGGESAENHSEYWAINYLHKAKEMGFLKEGDFTDFKAQIKREEMAVLIIRFLERRENISDINIEGIGDLILDFNYVGQESKTVNHDKRDAVSKNYVLGILTGYEDSSFKPKGILTRAEAATVIVRLLEPSRRVKLEYEALKKNKEKEMIKHYYGGSKWVNPADASIPKIDRVIEDRYLTTGKLDFSPYLHSYIQNRYVMTLSVDDVRGSIKYNKNGAKEGQLEDFEKLLLRRMPKNDVDKIMKYLSKKTSEITHLEYVATDFIVNEGRYLVRLGETINTKNSSYSVTFNIYYRLDEEWKKNYKKYLDFNYHVIK